MFCKIKDAKKTQRAFCDKKMKLMEMYFSAIFVDVFNVPIEHPLMKTTPIQRTYDMPMKQTLGL